MSRIARYRAEPRTPPQEKHSEQRAFFACAKRRGPIYYRGFCPNPGKPFGGWGIKQNGAGDRSQRAATRSGKERLEMAESKVQKVARQGTARKSVGACQCGGELIWAQVVLTRPRMLKVCEKCGSFHEKDQA